MYQTKGNQIETSTNQFASEYDYIFVNDQQAAYETLEAAGIEMANVDDEPEQWTDIMCDNSDPNYRKWYAVYGEGSRMSNSHAVMIEIEPTEEHEESLIAFMPE